MSTRKPKAKPAASTLSFDGMSDAAIAAMDGDAFADTLLQKMEQNGPMLTCEQMDDIEATWERQRRNRRAALVLLTKPWAWLNQRVAEDRDFAIMAAQLMTLANDVGLYRGLAECMEQVRLWAMVALSAREDMDSVLADAEVDWGEP